ncbi:hypothetical protein GUJ93_ZPchr0010g7670 [Zizania palustris]|uniref:Uncharacterized protein n=1 Tax=Zizania palustris TaxID=103762 RepID=A0A8J5WCX4_ZIZPA|nr:hypothetical protein GUJ93_ZPchr0010g7670 [Zizania palustris]
MDALVAAAQESGPERCPLWDPFAPPALQPRAAAVLASAGLLIATAFAARRRVGPAPVSLGVHPLQRAQAAAAAD